MPTAADGSLLIVVILMVILIAAIAIMAASLRSMARRQEALMESIADLSAKSAQHEGAVPLIEQAVGLMGSSLTSISEQMGAMSGDVRDMQRRLGNTARRGAIGEAQCESVLLQTLPQSQIVKNAAIKEGTRQRVEFAVKIPAGNGESRLLAIDSKFPGDTYSALCAAEESNNRTDIKSARNSLKRTIDKEAKDIGEKYINPPVTMDFAILFLPYEGLYTAVMDMDGLSDSLWEKQRVIVAGPSTLTAIVAVIQQVGNSIGMAESSPRIVASFERFQRSVPEYEKHISDARACVKKANASIGALESAADDMSSALHDLMRDAKETVAAHGGGQAGECVEGEGAAASLSPQPDATAPVMNLP